MLLAACSEIPPQAYYNRGDPENLLDVSSEVVHVDLSSHSGYTRFSDLIKQDPPTHVILNCSPDMKSCADARRLLDKRGITSHWGQGDQGATLVYQRVVARNCEQRYIDNSINPYNLPPPTMGCSLMANTVQMVSDKRQFVNPSLTDFRDGGKTVQNYEEYMKPPVAVKNQNYWNQVGGGGNSSGSGSAQ